MSIVSRNGIDIEYAIIDEPSTSNKHTNKLEYNAVIRTECPNCNKEFLVLVKEADIHKFIEGTKIQFAFPYLSSNDREKILTGICDKCWSNMFKEE
jgi:hypothetical protein